VTAQDPARVPDAAAPTNTFSYVAIACGVLAFVISWLIFGVLGVALGFVARGRREQRWKTGMIVAVVGMVLGLLSVLLL
jgi:dipeptide/tripeptide permease